MSSSSDGPDGPKPEADLPKLTIASAGDLFHALRSDSGGVRLSVLSAISKSPDKALSYGLYNGRDLLEEMFAQLTAARDSRYRLALLKTIAVFRAPQVTEVMKATFRATTDAREAAVCAARLSDSTEADLRRFFSLFLKEEGQLQARLAANILAHFDDHPSEDRVRIAILSDEAFPIPELDNATEAVWMSALCGPSSQRARRLLESLGEPAFVMFRRQWSVFPLELKTWLLEWGARSHRAYAVDLFLKAFDEGPEDLHLAALRNVEGFGAAAGLFHATLSALSGHPDRRIRLASLRAGAVVKDPRGRLGEEPDLEVRLLLIPRLTAVYGTDAVPDLLDLLHDHNWKIRNAAVSALGVLGAAVADAVEPLAEDEDLSVRVAVEQVLRGIDGLESGPSQVEKSE